MSLLQDGWLTSICCSSVGHCLAVGQAGVLGGGQPFYARETKPVWAAAQSFLVPATSSTKYVFVRG